MRSRKETYISRDHKTEIQYYKQTDRDRYEQKCMCRYIKYRNEEFGFCKIK